LTSESYLRKWNMLANILIAQLVDLAQQGRASQMSILRFEHIETPKYFKKKSG
jgi:hypothetical protein